MREGSDECALAGRGSAEEGRFQLGLGTNETRRESSVKVRRCELVEEAPWALALLEWGGQARGKGGTGTEPGSPGSAYSCFGGRRCRDPKSSLALATIGTPCFSTLPAMLPTGFVFVLFLPEHAREEESCLQGQGFL